MRTEPEEFPLEKPIHPRIVLAVMDRRTRLAGQIVRDRGRLRLRCEDLTVEIRTEHDTQPCEGWILRAESGFIFTTSRADGRQSDPDIALPGRWIAGRIHHGGQNGRGAKKNPSTVHVFIEEPITAGNLRNGRGYLCGTGLTGGIETTQDPVSCGRCRQRARHYARAVRSSEG